MFYYEKTLKRSVKEGGLIRANRFLKATLLPFLSILLLGVTGSKSSAQDLTLPIEDPITVIVENGKTIYRVPLPQAQALERTASMAYNLRPYTDSIYVLSQIVGLQNKQLQEQIKEVIASNDRLLSSLQKSTLEVSVVKQENASLKANLTAVEARSSEWRKKYRKTKLNSVVKDISFIAIVATGAYILIQN